MARLKKKKIEIIKTDEEMILIHHRPHTVPEPTRFFKAGEVVSIGNLDNPQIVASYFENKIYKIKSMEKESDKYDRKTGNKLEVTKFFDWVSIYKVGFGDTDFTIDCGIEESGINTSLSELLHTYYCVFGINMDVEYQRGFVWSEKEKTRLIDSIFDSVEIGRIVLRRLSYKQDQKYIYEIVDGKQRLSTLIDFFLGKWKYRGVLYEDLSAIDRYTFDQFSIVAIIIEKVTDLQVLKYFIKINKTSKPISEQHFEKLYKMIGEKNVE